MTGSAAMSLSDALWRQLRREASRPFLRDGRVAYYFARGKLRHDPVFRALLERRYIAAGSRVLDLGCGQGLIAALLHAVERVHGDGEWPADAPPAPLRCSYHGIELMPDLVALAGRTLGTLPGAPRFVCADAAQAVLPPSDVVLLLDVLHYVDLPVQQVLLQHIRESLSPRGQLLMRVGDAANMQRHAFSQWVDRMVVRVRGQRAQPRFGRPLSSWIALLDSLGFQVDAMPMSQGTPFTNVMLVARVASQLTLSIEDAVA